MAIKRTSVKRLPIFMQDEVTRGIFEESIDCIPKRTKAYLVGGAVRNALYYSYFAERMPQRDYDLLLVGNIQKFVSNLRSRGFAYGKIRRKHEIVVKKRKFEGAKEPADYVCFDIHISEEPNVKQNLKENANFTINGSALELKHTTSVKWKESLISIPNALKDIRNRQIRINIVGHPADLFACMRFISIGFKEPSREEVERLLIALRKLPKYKFKKNVRKIFDYVGGEDKARKLARKLGIKEDIFNIEKLRARC